MQYTSTILYAMFLSKLHTAIGQGHFSKQAFFPRDLKVLTYEMHSVTGLASFASVKAPVQLQPQSVTGSKMFLAAQLSPLTFLRQDISLPLLFDTETLA